MHSHPPTLTARRPSIDFKEPIPARWFGGNAYGSAMLDSLSLLLPEGERFMIRAASRFESHVGDAALRASVRGFILQEAQHTVVHLEHARALAATSPASSQLTGLQSRDYRLLYRLPFKLQLAIAAAIEHFTAVLGAFSLRTRCYDGCPPAMRALWYWHAAEEIEHKAVVYDLLQAVAPRNYPLRVTGYLLAVLLLARHIGAGIRLRLAEQNMTKARVTKSRRALLGMFPKEYGRALRLACLAYLRPGFHPDRFDDRHLAREYFASHAI